MTEQMEEDNPSEKTTMDTEMHTPPKTQTIKKITVEDSIEAITDIISELEEDDPLVQTQLSQPDDTALQQAAQLKASSYSHRLKADPKFLSLMFQKPLSKATIKYTSKEFTKLFTPTPKRPATPNIIEIPTTEQITLHMTNTLNITPPILLRYTCSDGIS
jgi:hypothetical protein